MSNNEMITRTVGPKAAKRAIRLAFECQRPIFLHGSPGLGKSDIIKQLGDELGYHVIDVRLSLWEPTDIKGIPYFDSNTGTMVWAPPSELPSEEFAATHKGIILFLDEMNSAAPAVQAAAYQLILNRRVGQYSLPNNVVIAAAGNKDSDRGVVFRMPAPLSNRFTHLDVSVDWDDYFDWAVANKIHKDVLGFLTFSKQDLFDFDPKSPSKAFATPRSWTFVSTYLQKKHADESTLTDLIAGTVGEGLAIKFMAHRKLANQLPNPQDILNGKVLDLKQTEVSAMYSLAVSMCYELKTVYDASLKKSKKNKEEKDTVYITSLNNVFNFMMKNWNDHPEIVIMTVKMMMVNYKLDFDADDVECILEFQKKYGKYIAAAV